MSRAAKNALALLTCLVAAGALAERPWPDKEFDCQVITTSGDKGIVVLQTFSLELAEERVVGLEAYSMRGKREPARSTVECVQRRKGERFSDSSFERWVERQEE